MKKESRERTKSARPRYILVFLAGMVIGCAGLYVAQLFLATAGILETGGRFNSEAELGAGQQWAQPLELPGVKNFHRVSDELYRGAQPAQEGMRQLKKLGIKTVVNLRSFHSSRDEIGQTKLDYEHIYAKPWHIEDKEVVRFLKIVTDPNRIPVFVHCQRGADRTGTMCAIYRIAVQGWTKEAAIEEMTKGGFGFYSGFENLVEYINELDMDDMKLRAGLK
ncbi:MAG: fused DSP-PTPase phosphatase/NAD kinase-like protein [Planctomycetota bacterium]